MQLYNLLKEKWIPVKRQSGTEEFIAPHEVVSQFHTDPTIELAAPRPDFNGALIQFLIGLVQTAFAPEDGREWRKYRDVPPSEDQLREAFAKFEFAFNLNGDGPRFMQDFDQGWILEASAVAINRLLIDEPGEQSEKFNKDFFVKRPIEGTHVLLSEHAAAMALFTLQINAPSGGAGHRTSVRGGGPLTTLIKGNCIWEDIWMNVLEQSIFSVEQTPTADCADQIFPWLTPTKTSTEHEKVEPLEKHPYHIYWTMPRRILLKFIESNNSCSIFTNQKTLFGCSEYFTKNYGNNYSETWIHPLTPYSKVKNQDAPVSKKAPEAGIGFRYWAALTSLQQDNIPAKVVERFIKSGSGSYRVCCFGYAMDNMKPLKWLDVVLPIYHLEQTDLELYSQEIARLIEVSSKFRGFISYASGLAIAGDRKPNELTEKFNSRIEPTFYLIANAFATNGLEDIEDLKRSWLDLLFRISIKVFDEYFLSGDWSGLDYSKVFSARSALHAIFYKNKSKLEQILNLALTQKEIIKRTTKKSKTKAEAANG